VRQNPASKFLGENSPFRLQEDESDVPTMTLSDTPGACKPFTADDAAGEGTRQTIDLRVIRGTFTVYSRIFNFVNLRFR
jgi:hypothetical protein